VTSESNTEEVYVLRRCPPTDRQEVINAQGAILEIPLLNVILPHKNDKQGLSVYLARQTSPHSLLQMRIDEIQSQLANAASSIEREKLLKRLGEGTVKSMVEAEGWRVVRIPLALFVRNGFDISDADNLGHLNIIGTREDFKKRLADLFGDSDIPAEITVLSKEECLLETEST